MSLEVVLEELDGSPFADSSSSGLYGSVSVTNLHGGEALQDDFHNIVRYANVAKGCCLIAAPPKVGSTSRTKAAVEMLRKQWQDNQNQQKKEGSASSFANQWKSVLLKYNEKLSKLEAEKSSVEKTLNMSALLPIYIDLRGLHMEEDILLGIWDQLNLPTLDDSSSLHQSLLGYLSQGTKLTLLVVDHVSRDAAAHIARLFFGVTDKVGILVVAEVSLDSSQLLAEASDKESLFGDIFLQKVSDLASILNISWNVETDKENERVLVYSTTLTSRTSKAVAASALGFDADSFFQGFSLRSPTDYLDGQVNRQTGVKFHTLPEDKKVVVNEKIDLVVDISEGIPGLITALVHFETPVLQQLHKALQRYRTVKSRLLSTNRYISAGRLCAVLARFTATLFQTLLSVEQDRIIVQRLLSLSCAALMHLPYDSASFPVMWDQFYGCQLNEEFVKSQLGCSDAFLSMLIARTLLVPLPAKRGYVIPSYVLQTLQYSFPVSHSTLGDHRQHIYTILFTHSVQTLGSIAQQLWVQELDDIRLEDVSMFQAKITTRHFPSLLPQLRTFMELLVSGEGISKQQVIMGLLLLTGLGRKILAQWFPYHQRLPLFQILADQVSSLSSVEVKEYLTTLCRDFKERKLYASSSGHALLLNILAGAQDALQDWWWMSGAEIFQSKHASSLHRQQIAQAQQAQSEAIADWVSAWLEVSESWVPESTAQNTLSVFTQCLRVQVHYKQQFFDKIVRSREPLESLSLVKIQEQLEAAEVSLKALSAQALSSVDDIHLESDDIAGDSSSSENSERPLIQRVVGSLRRHLARVMEVARQTADSQVPIPDEVSHEEQSEQQALHRKRQQNKYVLDSRNLDLFALTSEEVEQAALVHITCSLPALYQWTSFTMIQLLLRCHWTVELQAAASMKSGINSFHQPSSASPFISLQGRLLFTYLCFRQSLSFTGVVGSSLVAAGTFTTPLAASTALFATEEDALLWNSYVQHLCGRQEAALSPTPWQSVLAMMYTHPVIAESERRVLGVIRDQLHFMSTCQEKAHAELTRIFEGRQDDLASSLLNMATPSLAVAHAGILYADLVSVREMCCPSTVRSEAPVDEEVEDSLVSARDICEDALAALLEVQAQSLPRHPIQRLFQGLGNFLLYEFTAQTVRDHQHHQEMQLLRNKPTAALTGAEALVALDQRPEETQLWDVAFDHLQQAFQLWQMSPHQSHQRLWTVTLAINGLNDFQCFYGYQELLQQGINAHATSAALVQLPAQAIESVHMYATCLEEYFSNDYARQRRFLSDQVLSYFALSQASQQLQQQRSTTSVPALLATDALASAALLDEESLDCVYDLQCRLNNVAIDQLGLCYVARVYDSLIGSQAVSLKRHSTHNNRDDSHTALTVRGFDHAISLYKRVMEQYRDFSQVLYAKELWEIEDKKPNGNSNKIPVPQKATKPLNSNMTLWGEIVEHVFAPARDPFFRDRAGLGLGQSNEKAQLPPRRKVVGGSSGSALIGGNGIDLSVTGSQLDDVVSSPPPPSTNEGDVFKGDELDREDAGDEEETEEMEVRLVENAAGPVLRLREYYAAVALRFADTLYLLAMALYRDGLARYKVAPQLGDEITDLVYRQHSAALLAAKQVYEQELSPRQYCPITLELLRTLARHQVAQREWDAAIQTYEDLLKIFLDTKFTSLLVLAEIYAEYGDVLLRKEEYFHASLMYQMAIDNYRDFDLDAFRRTHSVKTPTDEAGQEEMAVGGQISSTVSEGGIQPSDNEVRQRKAAVTTPLKLYYHWDIFLPAHLVPSCLSEEIIKDRVVRNLLGKAKALLAAQDYEQAQECAEQTLHVLSVLMVSTWKQTEQSSARKNKKEKREEAKREDTGRAEEEVDEEEDRFVDEEGRVIPGLRDDTEDTGTTTTTKKKMQKG